MGPTFDDKTLEGLGLALEVPLELNKFAIKSIQKKYRDIFSRGISKTDKVLDSRRKMAFLPKGSIPIENPVGTAPAVKLEINLTTIFALPGVPEELKTIFENSIVPIIKEKIEDTEFFERNMQIEGIVESEIAEHIEKVMKKINYIYIKSHPQGYEGIPRINIHITSSGGKNRLENINKAAIELEKIILKMGGKIL